jgi:molybdopterin molybdotransferase
MISVQEAEHIIEQHSEVLSPVSCPLAEAHGRILREDIYADRDQPPYHRVMMDGIAISPKARESGQTTFQVEAIQAAGASPIKLKDPQACIHVMTGAVLPIGCDCVIPYEDLNQQAPCVELKPDLILKPMQWVHEQGADRKKGEKLLESGTWLRAPQVAILASLGQTTVQVGQKPSVAVVSTGDEVVDVGSTVETYQIRPSNAYGIRAALKQAAYNRVTLLHSRDDAEAMRHCLMEALVSHDVLVISGGVSMGKYDYVPAVLQMLSIAPLFHKIRQRPGKPFWFGATPGGKRVFALPGNPLSNLICFHRYVLPSLHRSAGARETAQQQVLLAESLPATGSMTLFVPVIMRSGNQASPIMHHNSGDLSAMAESTGFIELPEGSLPFEKGAAVIYHPWS